MVLRDSLYKIDKIETTTDNKAIYTLSLNAEHFIYKAHFPESPITPGVCIVQIVQEILENHVQKSLSVSKVKNVKFLSVIDPRETTTIECELNKVTIDSEQNQVAVQATLSSGTNALSKVSMICAYK